ncbi:hypothetical protein [Bdellovibrio sp. HCB337]|uniref:hypothetical protein n=1 Tax=Bdellovibrio sp. HCB337 TaxID=3394358 RepID=UPI0039A6A965
MKRILSFGLALSLALSTNLALAQDKEKKETGSAPAPAPAAKKESVVIPPRETKEEDILKGLDYPELQVVPRATDRLLMETQNEREYGWIAFWPYQVSSIATILAGNRLRGNYKADVDTDAEKKDSDNVGMAAMAVGIGGLGLSIFLIKSDLYGDSFRRVKAVKVTDKRSELMRERLAEEALEKPAHLINMLTTISVTLNLAANLAVLSQANGDVRAYAAVGVAASFLPWMFSNRYVDNWNKHLEYKRKIYTPLVGWDLQYVPKSQQFQPQLTANWSF